MENEAVCKDPKDLLPEGAFVEGEIRIVSYINERGEEMWTYTHSEGLVGSRIMGLLDLTKLVIGHELVHSYYEDEEDA